MAEREGKGARISRIAVLVFSARPGSEELLGTIARAVPGDRELFLNDDCPVPAPERFRRAPAEDLARCDLLVPLGGDGTALSAARIAGKSETPILAVNLGRTGFRTDCTPERLPSFLASLADGGFETRDRAMLDVVQVRGGKEILHRFALNEVQVLPACSGTRPGRLVDLHVELDGRYLTDYHADFLLVCTPTGSTGYNLSSGGPVVHPEAHCVVVQAVNSPALSVRPLIVDEKSEILLRSNERGSYDVVIDGRQHVAAEEGDAFRIRLSRTRAKFVKIDDYTFVDALRDKLGWSGHYLPRKGSEC